MPGGLTVGCHGTSPNWEGRKKNLYKYCQSLDLGRVSGERRVPELCLLLKQIAVCLLNRPRLLRLWSRIRGQNKSEEASKFPFTAQTIVAKAATKIISARGGWKCLKTRRRWRRSACGIILNAVLTGFCTLCELGENAVKGLPLHPHTLESKDSVSPTEPTFLSQHGGFFKESGKTVTPVEY